MATAIFTPDDEVDHDAGPSEPTLLFDALSVAGDTGSSVYSLTALMSVEAARLCAADSTLALYLRRLGPAAQLIVLLPRSGPLAASLPQETLNAYYALLALLESDLSREQTANTNTAKLHAYLVNRFGG